APPAGPVTSPPAASACGRFDLPAGARAWMVDPLHLRLPAAAVLPAPQLRRLRVADDLARGRVEVDRPPRPVGDVAQVAEERALLPLLDLGVGLLPGAHAAQEVGDVADVAGLAGLLFGHLAVRVEDLVAGVGDVQDAPVAVEGDEGQALALAGLAA